MTGGGQCSIPNAPGTTASGAANATFYGLSTGVTGTVSSPPVNVGSTDAPGNFWFTSTGSPIPTQIAAVLTNQVGTNNQGLLVFGYYQTNSTGTVPSISALNPLFNTSRNGVGASSTFSVASGQNYGFYLENIQGQGLPSETDIYYFMNASADFATNGGTFTDPNQHFAVFESNANPNNFIIGGSGAPACVGGNTPFNSPCGYPLNLRFQ